MSSKEKITILIPTKNRADFLVRLLHYLADSKFQDWIFIGDSSNDWHIDETKKTIESLQDRLKVRHFECPGLSAVGAMEHMNQSVTTPYCVFSADDDLLCVNGMNRSIDFLESNPDFGVAHGLAIATSVASGPYGNINFVNYYPHIALNAGSGSQRLRIYFETGPYYLLHDVHRTPDWIDLNQGFLSMSWARQGFIFDGLTSAAISAIRNRVKELDCLYLLRFGHDRVYTQVDVYDWFTSQDWFPGFKDLHDRAIDELTRQDGIGNEAAEEVFKQAFWPYLGRLFSRSLPSPKSEVPYSILKEIAAKIPGFLAIYRQIMRQIMSRSQTKGETNLLPSLLKSTSPYHKDFMPIYRAISTPIEQANNHKKEI